MISSALLCARVSHLADLLSEEGLDEQTQLLKIRALTSYLKSVKASSLCCCSGEVYTLPTTQQQLHNAAALKEACNYSAKMFLCVNLTVLPQVTSTSNNYVLSCMQRFPRQLQSRSFSKYCQAQGFVVQLPWTTLQKCFCSWVCCVNQMPFVAKTMQQRFNCTYMLLLGERHFYLQLLNH